MATTTDQAAKAASPAGRSIPIFIWVLAALLVGGCVFLTLIAATAWALGLIFSELSVDTRFLMATMVYSTMLVMLSMLLHAFAVAEMPRAIAREASNDASDYEDDDDDDDDDDDQFELDRPAWIAIEHLGFVSRRDYEAAAILDGEVTHSSDRNRPRKVNRNRRQRRKSR